MGLITINAYSKHRKVSYKAVKKAIETGRIETVKKGKKNMIDPEKADQLWEERTDPTRKPDKNLGSAFHQAKAIRETYQAKTAKIEYEEKAGKLISVEVVEEEAFKAGRRIREALLNIPSRLVAQLVATFKIKNKGAAHKASLLLEKEINAICKELGTLDD